MLGERRFRRLDGSELLADVYQGRTFTDGKAVFRSNRKEEKAVFR
ncbi:MAG TPA: hypothetical protein VMK12_13300 [Anaeromyxobacteraceae bacterium]|nr:hypothetical protein [Anaeromyxobacteraceae bacterium]